MKHRATFVRQLSFLQCRNNRNLGYHSTVNPSIAKLKPQSNGPSQSNSVTGTLAVDGWAVTARRGLGGTAARPGPSLY